MYNNGQFVDRYIIEDVVGEDDLGWTYNVKHTLLGSAHQLRVIRGDRFTSSHVIAGGRDQGSLHHVNIVPVTDVLSLGEHVGMVSSRVEGPRADRWLSAFRPTQEEALNVFRAIVRGVRHAHQKEVAHGGLTAHSVIVSTEEGRIVPKITDFGIREHEDASPGDDLQALGHLLAQLLTGTDQPDPGHIGLDTTLRDVIDRLKSGELTDCQTLLEQLDDPTRDAQPFSPPPPPSVPSPGLSAFDVPEPTSMEVIPPPPMVPASDEEPKGTQAEETVEQAASPPEEAETEAYNYVESEQGPGADLGPGATAVPEETGETVASPELPPTAAIGPPQEDDDEEDLPSEDELYAPLPTKQRKPWIPLVVVGVLVLLAIGVLTRGSPEAPASDPKTPQLTVKAPLDEPKQAQDEMPSDAAGDLEGVAGQDAVGEPLDDAMVEGNDTVDARDEDTVDEDAGPEDAGAEDAAIEDAAIEDAAIEDAVAEAPPKKTRPRTRTTAKAPEPEAPANGTIHVQGDAKSVWVQVNGSWRPAQGELPAGTYAVKASFDADDPIMAGNVTITAGQGTTLKCSSFAYQCR